MEEEIGEAITISSISWHRAEIGSSSADFVNFKIYMGLAAGNELGTRFDENYADGTRALVYEATSHNLSAGPGEWVSIPLDTPYWYDGQGNLVIEVQWAGGVGSFYTYEWDTGSDRCVTGASPGSESGTVGSEMSQLLLEGALSLQMTTFGAIKAGLGNWE